MKATINGIVVEGTPQEIHELMVQMGPVKFKPFPQDTSGGGSTIRKALEVWTSGGVPTIAKQFENHSKCPAIGPCYCTGACLK